MTADTRFEQIVATVLEIPEQAVVDELGPALLGQWTSLRHIRLVAAMEDAYGIKFASREIRSLRTVGELRELVRTKESC